MCIISSGRRRSLIEAEACIAFLEESSESSEPSSSGSEKEEAENHEEQTATTKKKNSARNTKSKKGETKRREIQHNYHDHADDDGAIYHNTPMVSKGGVTVPFPMKLHNMLDHISQHESQLSSIVTWQPHGRSFIVKNINRFAEDVLPRFFQQRKYASFQRQLNLYGFTRLTKGPDRGSYYHELFLRSKKILCRGIVRMKVKGTGSRMASNPEQEPNFYLMAFMPAPDTDRYEDIPSTKVKSVKSVSTDVVPSTTLSSSQDNEQGSFKVVPIVTQSSDLQNSPECTQKADDDDDEDEDMNDINFVFDSMPFHELSEGSRRHSLMDIQRARRLSAQFARRSSLRNSFLLVDTEARRSSIKSLVIADEEFEKEMEAIRQLGEKVLSDQDMTGVLDKIIDHRML